MKRNYVLVPFKDQHERIQVLKIAPKCSVCNEDMYQIQFPPPWADIPYKYLIADTGERLFLENNKRHTRTISSDYLLKLFLLNGFLDNRRMQSFDIVGKSEQYSNQILFTQTFQKPKYNQIRNFYAEFFANMFSSIPDDYCMLDTFCFKYAYPDINEDIASAAGTFNWISSDSVKKISEILYLLNKMEIVDQLEYDINVIKEMISTLDSYFNYLNCNLPSKESISAMEQLEDKANENTKVTENLFDSDVRVDKTLAIQPAVPGSLLYDTRKLLLKR